MSPALQVRLLRAIELGEVRPVGGRLVADAEARSYGRWWRVVQERLSHRSGSRSTSASTIVPFPTPPGPETTITKWSLVGGVSLKLPENARVEIEREGGRPK